MAGATKDVFFSYSVLTFQNGQLIRQFISRKNINIFNSKSIIAEVKNFEDYDPIFNPPHQFPIQYDDIIRREYIKMGYNVGSISGNR